MTDFGLGFRLRLSIRLATVRAVVEERGKLTFTRPASAPGYGRDIFLGKLCEATVSDLHAFSFANEGELEITVAIRYPFETLVGFDDSMDAIGGEEDASPVITVVVAHFLSRGVGLADDPPPVPVGTLTERHILAGYVVWLLHLDAIEGSTSDDAAATLASASVGYEVADQVGAPKGAASVDSERWLGLSE